MSLALTILLLALMGAFGGLLNCTLRGEFPLPHFHKASKTWRPGWIGNVLLGAVAAVLVWGIYNPAAFYEFSRTPADLHLNLAQLLSSIAVGISGARVLKAESRKSLLHQKPGTKSEGGALA